MCVASQLAYSVSAIIPALDLTTMPKVQEQSFATSYDLSVKLISAVVILGFLVLFIITKSAIAGALGLTVITLGYLYSPRSHEITDHAIIYWYWIAWCTVGLTRLR